MIIFHDIISIAIGLGTCQVRLCLYFHIEKLLVMRSATDINLYFAIWKKKTQPKLLILVQTAL